MKKLIPCEGDILRRNTVFINCWNLYIENLYINAYKKYRNYKMIKTWHGKRDAHTNYCKKD